MGKIPTDEVTINKNRKDESPQNLSMKKLEIDEQHPRDTKK